MTAIASATIPSPYGLRPEVAVRPGVMFPNWSVVESQAAQDTLNAILDLAWAERRWDDYSGAEDRIRRAVFEGYLRTGRAPTMAELSALSGLPTKELRGVTERLQARDLIVLDGAGEVVVGAYPLTNRATGHRVSVGGTEINAMCAIDALGVGAMYGRDAKIVSSCRGCGSPIHVQTRNAGAALEIFAPAGAVVWSGIQYKGGCAANSLCTEIAFFCSAEHLRSWRAAEASGARGYVLSMDDAFQVGVALFSPALMPATHDPEQDEG